MKASNKKTFIVLIYVNSSVDSKIDERPFLESIENKKFIVVNPSECETVSATKIKKEIVREFNLNVDDAKKITVLPITDFMDDFNSDELDSNNFFIGYVTAKTIKRKI